MAVKVAINGFGRIGRLAFRQMFGAELKAELFNLRFQLATGQLQNTTVIANTKRDIARCMTILREQELKDAQ